MDKPCRFHLIHSLKDLVVDIPSVDTRSFSFHFHSEVDAFRNALDENAAFIREILHRKVARTLKEWPYCPRTNTLLEMHIQRLERVAYPYFWCKPCQDYVKANVKPLADFTPVERGMLLSDVAEKEIEVTKKGHDPRCKSKGDVLLEAFMKDYDPVQSHRRLFARKHDGQLVYVPSKKVLYNQDIVEVRYLYNLHECQNVPAYRYDRVSKHVKGIHVWYPTGYLRLPVLLGVWWKILDGCSHTECREALFTANRKIRVSSGWAAKLALHADTPKMRLLSHNCVVLLSPNEYPKDSQDC